VRPIASLHAELLSSGAALVVVGLAGVVAALIAGLSPVRGLIVFAVAAVVVGLAQHFVGGRWMRSASADAPPPSSGTRIEPRRRTIIRTLVLQGIVYVLLVAILFLLRPALGATIGGVLVGVGVANLLAVRWVGARDARTGSVLMREVASSPIGGGRRPLYTLPRRDATLAT
jgi:uncharacterized membrane-anchored protein